MLNKSVVSIEYDNKGKLVRRIRSFVRRQGRLTKGQTQAIEELWPKFGIDYQKDTLLNFTDLFSAVMPITLEIGFGMGHSLVAMAEQNPDRNYLGIEVHQPGIGSCLMTIKEKNLTNIRVMCHDAVEVLQTMIPDESLAMVQLFFPDPWHKKRHHKRRIVQLHFVNLVAKKLVSQGLFHMATDWQNYAEYMLKVMSISPHFSVLSGKKEYMPRPDSRLTTKFELRGQQLGLRIWDLIFKRNNIVFLAMQSAFCFFVDMIPDLFYYV